MAAAEASDSGKPGPGAMEVAPGIHVADDAIRFQFSRSSGPGGQNVNKLSTKAELWVPIGALRGLRADAADRLRHLAGKRLTKEDEIHIVAETARTQEANRADAMERLRELLVQAMHRPKTRRKTRPTRASRERRLQAKRQRSATKARRAGQE